MKFANTLLSLSLAVLLYMHFSAQNSALKSKLQEQAQDTIRLNEKVSSLEKSRSDLKLDLLKSTSKEEVVSKADFAADGSHKNDPFLGPKDAPVVLMAFSDFQCRPCRKFFELVFPEIKKSFIENGKIKFIFRDFPLDTNIQAKEAASLAHCAGEQGQYWKAHKLLYSNIEDIDQGDFSNVIEKLQIDSEKLKRCLKSGRYLKEIEEDVSEGLRIGAKGAPGFFLGKTQEEDIYQGIFIRGAQPFPALENLISKLIDES